MNYNIFICISLGFFVLWESPESASYNGAFRPLEANFGTAEKRAPNLLGPRLELLSRGHRTVESGNQTSQNPPESNSGRNVTIVRDVEEIVRDCIEIECRLLSARYYQLGSLS